MRAWRVYSNWRAIEGCYHSTARPRPAPARCTAHERCLLPRSRASGDYRTGAGVRPVSSRSGGHEASQASGGAEAVPPLWTTRTVVFIGLVFAAGVAASPTQALLAAYVDGFLRQPPRLTAAVNAIKMACSAIFALVGGVVADRVGRRAALVIGLILAISGAFLLVVETPWHLLALAVIAERPPALSPPAVRATCSRSVRRNGWARPPRRTSSVARPARRLARMPPASRLRSPAFMSSVGHRAGCCYSRPRRPAVAAARAGHAAQAGTGPSWMAPLGHCRV